MNERAKESKGKHIGRNDVGTWNGKIEKRQSFRSFGTNRSISNLAFVLCAYNIYLRDSPMKSFLFGDFGVSTFKWCKAKKKTIPYTVLTALICVRVHLNECQEQNPSNCTASNEQHSLWSSWLESSKHNHFCESAPHGLAFTNNQNKSLVFLW